MRIPGTVLALLWLLGGCASGIKVIDLRHGQTGWVSYPSTLEKLELSGQLVLPDRLEGKAPAMIVAHASGGLDRRNERWASFLRQQGIATFQIDYFGPRGVTPTSAFQPLPVHDAYDALRLLATHPKIDATRIGIIGFSRGASMALQTTNADAGDTGSDRFAAHVALYPTCTFASVLRGGSGAPVLILVGTHDDLVSVSDCERVAKAGRAEGRDVTLKVYEGAYHGWDGDTSGVWFHRAINRSYTMIPDSKVTAESRKDVLEFLQRALKL